MSSRLVRRSLLSPTSLPASRFPSPHRAPLPLPASTYSTSLPLPRTHTCTPSGGPSVPRFYSDATVAPPTRDASKHSLLPSLSAPSIPMYRRRRLMPPCCGIYSRAVLVVLSIPLPPPSLALAHPSPSDPRTPPLEPSRRPKLVMCPLSCFSLFCVSLASQLAWLLAWPA